MLLNVVLCISDAGLEPPLATLQHTLLSQAMCIETKKQTTTLTSSIYMRLIKMVLAYM